MSLFTRKARHGVLFNLTSNFLQIARIEHLEEKPLDLREFAEFGPDDTGAWTAWINRHLGERRRGHYHPAFCGFHPPERMLIREIITPRRLTEPGYLPGLLSEHARVANTRDWMITALNPMDGTPLPPEGNPRHALIFALPRDAIRRTQEQLLKLGLRPRRLEVSTLGLLGALIRHRAQTGYAHAIAVCEIELNQTRLYIIAKDGVHVLNPLPHGLLSITEAAMKELDAPDAVIARRLLEAPTEDLVAHGRKLTRVLSRHFKPAVDHFELKTGHRIDALHCTQLPTKLAWLAPALGTAVDLQLIEPDLAALMGEAGLKVSADGEAVSPNWLASLSLVSELAPPAEVPA